MPVDKIIIVEDELVYVAYLRRILENLGYEVCGSYSTGEEALKNLKNSQPDCILMDIGLSNSMDGLEAADIIRKETSYPVVFLTSETGTKQMKLADEISHFGYLIKPVHPEHLDLTIKSAIQRNRHETGLNH
jgi:DNA-binding NarL/FixJ family response regulator